MCYLGGITRKRNRLFQMPWEGKGLIGTYGLFNMASDPQGSIHMHTDLCSLVWPHMEE